MLPVGSVLKQLHAVRRVQRHVAVFRTLRPGPNLFLQLIIIIIIITVDCEQLAPTDYVKRRDGLAKIIHQKLSETAELIDDKSP